MRVLLLEQVENLGNLGDEVRVRNGYARNYLIPQRKALRANDENRKRFEEQRAELEEAAIKKLHGAEKRAAQLLDRSITIFARVASEERLYGSIGPLEISRELEAQGIEVHKSEIQMPEGPLRKVGEYIVTVHLHAGVSAELGVIVEPE
ncbi:MAG: 50S ribosomal protein L9 [Pseudomonadales bacterium]|nr:50S ribosomal protein L9 [Pseudomonadales bacterium]